MFALPNPTLEEPDVPKEFSYDDECEKLAAYFLVNQHDGSPDDLPFLAQEIQDVIEAFLTMTPELRRT